MGNRNQRNKKTSGLNSLSLAEVPFGLISAPQAVVANGSAQHVPRHYDPAAIAGLFSEDAITRLLSLNHIVVRAIGKGGKRHYQLLAGFTHWQLLTLLGLPAAKKVTVRVVPGDLAEADYALHACIVDVIWPALLYPLEHSRSRLLRNQMGRLKDEHPTIWLYASECLMAGQRLTPTFIETRLMGRSSGTVNRRSGEPNPQQAPEARR